MTYYVSSYQPNWKCISHKRCSRHKTFVMLNDFYKDSSRSDGHDTICKSCDHKGLKRKRNRQVNRQRYPERHAAQEALRRFQKLNATPKWVNKKDLLCFYENVQKKTSETGKLYEVDHIVPLKHDLVCGLHVPWNLQILTASKNASKSNSFDVLIN